MWRKNKIGILLFILISALMAQRKFEDSFTNYLEVEKELPFFYYEVTYHPLPNKEKIKIDINIQVPFGAIQFIKKDNLFEAKYEVSLLILDENDVSAASKIWTQTIQTRNFSETSSLEHYDINHLYYELKPSKYFLTIGIRDLDTKKSVFRKKSIDLKDFYKKSLAIGSLVIVSKVNPDSQTVRDEMPAIIGSVDDTEPNFDIYFDLLSEGGKANISYQIFDAAKKVVVEKSYQKDLPKGVHREIITISKTGLGYNRYRIVVKVKMGKEEVSSERLFQVRWYGMSDLITNLDSAIEQLRYIAKPSELKALKKAKDAEKKELFLEFWKKRDPTPETPENELMEEYYKRVNYANAHFTGFLEGWRTDMGMVFILFGPPSDIERHPFELSTKPYEVWYYYEINRTFVFVDETGFGDYRLVTPFELYDAY